MEGSREAAPLTLEVVARPAGGERRLTRLHPALAHRYEGLVAPSIPVIERALGHEVIANRARARGRHATTSLEPWRRARSIWRREIEAAAIGGAAWAVLATDVTDCYAALAPGVVMRRLRAVGVTTGLDPLERCLRAIAERGTAGLPVGPAPSAVLANVALKGVDDRIREAGVRHLRWVDDVVIICRSRRDVVRGFDAFRRGLDDLGLRPNLRKTAVLRDQEAIGGRLLRGAGVSACDDAAP